MSRPIIILDANIVVKLLHAETDTEQARDFLRSCVDQKARILVPEHFLYELFSCDFLRFFVIFCPPPPIPIPGGSQIVLPGEKYGKNKFEN